MSLPLLQTKLYAPPPRPHLVQRSHLLDQLRGHAAHRLTLISAPAGFGKTTLISAWVAHFRFSILDVRAQRAPAQSNDFGLDASTQKSIQNQVAWLSLDDDDNDPTRFLTYVIAALQTAHTHLGVAALALLAAPQPPPPQALLTRLINELATLTTPLALILDDYHVITNPVLHEGMTFLIDHLPPQIHLVIITRIDPPLPLARWRARHQLIEVRAVDLRFTPAEATVFLNEAMGLTLSTSEVAALETRTEGWIAGLQLAALSLQGRADVAGFIQAFSGSHRHVLSYLAEEVLNRRPEGTLDFLLQTSLLERLTAALCNAVTGRADGQALLEKLEQANLFLIPLDDEGRWYRYHHLFAEVLRTRLQQTQPAIIPQLHQRASAWFAAAGQIEPAVAHALAAQDVEQAANLVERVGLSTLLQQSEVLLMRRLVERLPAAAIYTRPYLLLVYGITLTLSGQFDRVEAMLAQAARVHTADLPPDIAGGLAMIRSTLARFRGERQLSLALAQQALHQLPSDALALRAAAALNMGAAYLEQGDRVAAGQALADAVAFGSAGGAEYLALAALEELATDQARQGQLVQAKQTNETALAKVNRWGSQRMPAAGLAHIGIGEVLVEWHKLAPATAALTMGIQILQGTTERGLMVRGYSALARRHWAVGAGAAALAALDEGEAWLTQMQIATPLTIAWLAAQRARLQVWQGDLAAARRWDQAIDPGGETALDYLEQLTRVRIRLAEQVRGAPAHFLAEAASILTPLLATAETKGWGSHVIEILLLQALLAQAAGNKAAAQSTLARALTLAQPAGYIRIFADEGPAMQFLIADYVDQGRRVDQGRSFGRAQQPHPEQNTPLSMYINKLLASFDNEPVAEAASGVVEQAPIHNPQSKIQNLIEPLSERELEVLRLVHAGYSNSEIAAKLIVTIGTIKKHINNIFGKLGVSSRTQALIRARSLNLL